MTGKYRLRCIGCGEMIEHVYSAVICTRCGMMMYSETTKQDVKRAAKADAQKDTDNKEVF